MVATLNKIITFFVVNDRENARLRLNFAIHFPL